MCLLSDKLAAVLYDDTLVAARDALPAEVVAWGVLCVSGLAADRTDACGHAFLNFNVVDEDVWRWAVVGNGIELEAYFTVAVQS